MVVVRIEVLAACDPSSHHWFVPVVGRPQGAHEYVAACGQDVKAGDVIDGHPIPLHVDPFAFAESDGMILITGRPVLARGPAR